MNPVTSGSIPGGPAHNVFRLYGVGLKNEKQTSVAFPSSIDMDVAGQYFGPQPSAPSRGVGCQGSIVGYYDAI